MTQDTGRYDAYVPRIASEWDFDAPGSKWRAIDGSLVFVDISGFTNLSEKLARRGRIGAEELTAVLNRVFGTMLDEAYARGGSLLKFGGDALLLLFEAEDHPLQASAAAVEMRAALRDAAKEPTSVGRIALRMSVGVHSGPIDFFLVGQSHRELIISGPVASKTTDMEGTADAGEIVVSPETKALLPPDFTGDAKGEGWLLRKRSIPLPGAGPVTRHALPIEEMRTFVPAALRAHLEAGGAEPEHRIATIGFLKYKGVDALRAEEGPEAVAEALHELVTITQEAVDAEGVTFLATDIDADGGKIILATGVPVTQPDDEGRMLRAARRILDVHPRLKIRIGTNRGHVFSGDVGTPFRRTFTVMGDTVNLAARLMAAADPGSLYAAPGVLDRSATLFRTEALEPFYVKGKSQPVQAYEVFEETGIRPQELRHELPFAGREEQLQTLIDALGRLPIGKGSVFTITGDTGLGKSRLIAEALERAPSCAHFVIQAEPLGADNAYWAFRDPLRRMLGIERGGQAEMADTLRAAVAEHVPELLPMLPLLGDVAQVQIEDTPETAAIEPRFRPDRTADAFLRLLEVIRSGPLAVIVEDRHWMDPASIALVRRLAGVAESHPWMVVVTQRVEGEHEALGTEILLEPLAEDDTRSLALGVTEATPLRPHQIDTIVTKAGGNPLFLGEILRVVRESGSTDDLPDSLDAVVGAEIDALQPLTRRLLRFSSVLGRSFRRSVLDEFLAPEEVELDAATQRDLARFIGEDGPDRWRFRHAVVHDVAYQGLSFRRRRELHARAGDVIERLAGDEPESVAEFLTTHYSLGGEHEKAWRYGVIAGDRARERYANNEAAAQYRMASEAAKRVASVDAEQTARILEALGDVCETAGRYDEADRAFGSARDLVLHDAEAQGRLMAKQGLIREKAGKLSTALTWFRRGLNLLEEEHEVGGHAMPELRLAYGGIRFRQGRYHDAIAWSKEALDDPGITDDQRAHALHLLVTAYAHIGSPEAVEAGRQAIEIYERVGDLVGLGNVLNNLGVNAYYRGDWQEALDLYGRSEEARRSAGDVIGAAASVNNLAEIYSDQGKLDLAESMFRDALYVWESSSFPVGVALASINLGRTLTRMGKLHEAWGFLERGREVFAGMGAQAFVQETDVRITEHHLFGCRRAEAGELATGLLDSMAKDESTLLPRAALQRALAYCSVARNRLDEAEEHFRTSLELAEKGDSLFEQALTYEGMARTLRRHPQATEWNDHQAELFARLGVIATPVIPLH